MLILTWLNAPSHRTGTPSLIEKRYAGWLDACADEGNGGYACNDLVGKQRMPGR
jgi:hypothetical protein